MCDEAEYVGLTGHRCCKGLAAEEGSGEDIRTIWKHRELVLQKW
jgi:hypothetical protein